MQTGERGGHSRASGADGGLVGGADADIPGQATVGSAGSKAWTQLRGTQLDAAKHWALGLADYDLMEKALQEGDEFPRGQSMSIYVTWKAVL